MYKEGREIMNIDLFNTFGFKVMMTVVGVCIAAGFIYLTLEQYQRPAQDKRSLDETVIAARDEFLRRLFMVEVGLVLASLAFTLWALWVPHTTVPIVGALAMVVTLIRARGLRQRVWRFHFVVLPKPPSRA